MIFNYLPSFAKEADDQHIPLSLSFSKWRKVIVILCLCIVGYILGPVAHAAEQHALPISIQQNNAFRNEVMRFVKETASAYVIGKKKADDPAMDNRWFNGGHPVINWAMEVTLYEKGKQIGKEQVNATSLSRGLIEATEQACQQAQLHDETALKNIRFKVTFYYPPDSRQYSFVDDKTQSAELIGNVVPVRWMDTALLKNRIFEEKAYLLRMIDPKMHALFKKYDVATDTKETKLRTIYTASGLFTLLKINTIFPDPVIEKQIEPMANFLLMMQVKEGENKGAFHYSYNPKTQQKDNHFVVGTASKTIFTLLLLYERTHDSKYLTAAENAGRWLMTKVDKTGRVNPILTYKATHWHQITKQSSLYSGQVLSALSRLYHATQNKAYYDKATLIAKRFVARVQQYGPFVGDDFRTPNSVSTSWTVMSLVDYAKVNKDPLYRKVITRCAQELLKRQAKDKNDAFNAGRVVDLISASGNGWVNEVMTVLYPFCRAERMSGCQAYKEFIVHSSRWLMQNVYTPANSFSIQNPAMAEGGAIPNFLGSIVRTDAVCHGGNSLIGLLNIVGLKEQVYEVLPEMSLDEVLGLLGIGKFPEKAVCARNV